MHKRFDLRSNTDEIYNYVSSYFTFKSICLINDYLNKIIDKIRESIDYFEFENNIKNKTTDKIMLIPNKKFYVAYENKDFKTRVFVENITRTINTTTFIINIYNYTRNGYNTIFKQVISLDEFMELDNTKFKDHYLFSAVGTLAFMQGMINLLKVNISTNLISFLYDNLK